MMGPEGEQPTDAQKSEGAEGSTNYAQMLVDAKQEAAAEAEAGSKLPAPAEVSQILNRANWTETTEGIERENLQSLSALESGTNNTGIGNTEFARSQLLAALYATRRHTLDRTMHDREGSTFSAETSEQLMAYALDEAGMWERMLKSEPLTVEEENLVRGRALSIRKAAAEQKATGSAEQPIAAPQPEQEQAAEQTALERAMEQIPDDSVQRSRFGEDNLEQFDPGKIDLLKAYFIKELRDLAARVPQGARYPDTIAGILGNGTRGPIRFLGAMEIMREGTQELDLHELAGKRFSEAMHTYLNMDIRQEVPDFDKKFG